MTVDLPALKKAGNLILYRELTYNGLKIRLEYVWERRYYLTPIKKK